MQIALTIDCKKNRIRIYKETLAEIGMPKYVYILVNPNNRKMAVKAAEKKTKDVLSITYEADKDCEFYSTELIQELLTLHQTDKAESYKMIGSVIQNEKLAVFDIDDMIPVNEMEHNMPVAFGGEGVIYD